MVVIVASLIVGATEMPGFDLAVVVHVSMIVIVVVVVVVVVVSFTSCHGSLSCQTYRSNPTTPSKFCPIELRP